MLLSSDLLSRINALPAYAGKFDWPDLRLYLLETVQMGDRQWEEKQRLTKEPTARFRPQFRHGENMNE
ncbi:hypothetical protein H6F67_14105 [Microcoleus sp. FACHB-1515]|uniref:hypothetical protein n=1 Tax=Cyanophyceae TaxID=3028117 RepID=UPI00168472A4|nr:hypothetical protein [Microcoleus sp. FACHB-1515]MBD2090985.1 hypothetical protein [Microcoleus sp. FACHB-1515]